MAKTKGEACRFPHVKGLLKKRTSHGHRWVLTEPDFNGHPRSITVGISDNDPIDVFYRKVNDARQELRRRCACKDFEEYLETYIAFKRLRANTQELYRVSLRGFSFDDKKNVRIVRELLMSELKPSTIRVKIGHVGAFFRWLIQRGEPVKDPTRDVTIGSHKSRRCRVFTAEEMEVLMAYARKKEPEYRLYILLLIRTGARCSTIGALTASSLDGENRLHMVNVKSDKRYDYPIVLNDAETLELWKEVSSDGKLWHRPCKNYHTALREWLRNHFGRDANGETLSPHSLRHTFATNAVREGVPIEIVSKLLDHSSMSITLNVYAKFSQEQIDDAVRRATKKGTVGGSSLDLEVSDERQMCKDNREIEVIIDDSVGK